MKNVFDYLWNEFWYPQIGRTIKTTQNFVGLWHLITFWASSASQSDNAAFRCDDEDNTKEEEVYQDLCAIQSSIARTRDQVFRLLLICHFA